MSYSYVTAAHNEPEKIMNKFCMTPMTAKQLSKNLSAAQIETAQKLAAAVTVETQGIDWWTTAMIIPAMDASNNNEYARVESNGVVLMNYVAADAATVRYADALVNERVMALNGLPPEDE